MDLRPRWGGQIGLVLYGTGDDINCPEGEGFAFGAEVRTRGAWLGAVGVDVNFADPGLCTLILPTTIYRGERVEVWGTTRLAGALRPRVRLGRAFAFGGLQVEPALGVGMIRSTSDFGVPGGERLWNEWVGGSVI